MSSEQIDELQPSERARFEEVCRFGQDKRDEIATTVALSFADDPIWKWIYDTDGPVPLEPAMVLARMLVAQSLPVDEIHGFRDFGAVALWTAPAGTGHADDEELRESQTNAHFTKFAAQLGDRISLTGELSQAMKKHRPEEPHWYLGILGAHPDRQGQGLGSRVLTTMLERCDEQGLPTFLESSNPRNYAFYRRHGYTEQEELVVADSPPLLAFWRPPR